MNAVINFEKAVQILTAEAPSEKARAFTIKLAEQIRAKGEAWITENVVRLHITDAEINDAA